MKILLCSLPFRPSVGGIESVSAVLAERLHRLGHEVVLVTGTPAEPARAGEGDPEPFRIERRPPAGRLMRLVREADLVFHNNISLRLAWPLLLWPRPWVIAHHTWIPRTGAGRLKRLVLRAAANVTVSRAMASDLPAGCEVIPNPFDPIPWRLDVPVERDRDIVFLGRLVSDKGVALLLQALHRLQDEGCPANLTVIGEGPEGPALHAECERLGLRDRVHFAGRLTGRSLARALHRHRVLAVPSVWEEPFGLVVLEGLACGCTPVVADSGGLPEAAGGLGVVFPRGDAVALAGALSCALAAATAPPNAAAHLQRHHPDRVVADYLSVFQHARRRLDHPRAA